VTGIQKHHYPAFDLGYMEVVQQKGAASPLSDLDYGSEQSRQINFIL